MSGGIRIRKVLTANDLGTTGSHQAGIHIPKSVREHFPSLDDSTLNPDRWIEIHFPDGAIQNTRFVHYNNKLLTDRGTRDEFRLTHVVPALKMIGAVAGDTIELVIANDDTAGLSLVREENETLPDQVTVNISGDWRVIKWLR